ncbi:MAG: DUF3089 domain-containing protein [Parasphingorhabdus sp.]
MKKWAIRIGVILLLLVGASYLFREQIIFGLMKYQMAPETAFDEKQAPPALDYAEDTAWAALPDMKDNADFVPEQLAAHSEPSEVAVFFMHPTTYLSDDGWNAPTDDPASSEFRDDLVLRAQASAFNGCCDVYAPKYRQATLWSFMDETGSGDKARAFAFTDIERAFDEFLKRIGDKPFIIAGHSQGGDHSVRLLKAKISGTPLKDRMVAAYPVGFGFQESDMKKDMPDIPVCSQPTQTGCYVTWNSLGAKATAFPDYVGAVCVNPLSWTTDQKEVTASQNPGSLGVGETTRFEKGVTSAQCQNDRLLVGEFQSDMFDNLPMNMGEDNHHILDYSLFYASIRKNASDRVEAYLEKNQS